ncbi:unannotated protein [freshwater metagenome]|uniref:Unannotated protein n=1 Tax=freshwater metagenome TaxID=449393 RepID=A0A6J6DMN5_9ZZZZ
MDCPLPETAAKPFVGEPTAVSHTASPSGSSSVSGTVISTEEPGSARACRVGARGGLLPSAPSTVRVNTAVETSDGFPTTLAA